MSRTTSAWIKPRIAGVLLASALALLPAPQTVACAFHTDLPEQTVGDWLVDGTEVVLARPDPDNEFTFHVTKVIHTTGEAPEINLLVSSDLRRKLLNHPDDTVLLAHDGVSWLILAYVDTTFRPIITEILAKAPGWDGGYNAERLAIFADLQDSLDIDMRLLALNEIDKAPYAMLREIDLRLTPEDLLRDLWSPFAYGYQPIRVLLLGLSDSDAARDEVRDFLLRVTDWEWANNLGAFATAEIELNGVAGVDFCGIVRLGEPFAPGWASTHRRKLAGTIASGKCRSRAPAFGRGVARPRRACLGRPELNLGRGTSRRVD